MLSSRYMITNYINQPELADDKIALVFWLENNIDIIIWMHDLY
jgi:hypothetical protein